MRAWETTVPNVVQEPSPGEWEKDVLPAASERSVWRDNYLALVVLLDQVGEGFPDLGAFFAGERQAVKPVFKGSPFWRRDAMRHHQKILAI